MRAHLFPVPVVAAVLLATSHPLPAPVTVLPEPKPKPTPTAKPKPTVAPIPAAAGRWRGVVPVRAINGAFIQFALLAEIAPSLRTVKGQLMNQDGTFSDVETVSASVSGKTVTWHSSGSTMLSTFRLTPNSDRQTANVSITITRGKQVMGSGSGTFQRLQ